MQIALLSQLRFHHKPACHRHLCIRRLFQNFFPDGGSHHLLLYNQHFFTAVIQIRNQFVHQRIADLIRSSVSPLQIFRRFQCRRCRHDVFFHIGNRFHIVQSVSHTIANSSFPFCCKMLPDTVSRAQITDILRCHAQNSDISRNHIFFFTGKHPEQLLPCFFFAFVI